MDEIDSLGSKRGSDSEHEASRRVKSELLVQMDGAYAVRCVYVSGEAPPPSQVWAGLWEGRTPPSWSSCWRLPTTHGTSTRPCGDGWRNASTYPCLTVYNAATNSPALNTASSLTPSAEDRRQLLDISLKEVRVADDCDLDEVAKHTEGYSGADITNVCRYIISVVSV